MKLPTPPPVADTAKLPERAELEEFFTVREKSRELVRKANAEDLNWDEVRHRALAQKFKPEHVWWWVVNERQGAARTTPMLDGAGRPFVLRDTDPARWKLRRIDLHLGGTVESAAPTLGDPAERERYMLTSLRAEAIDSS